MDSPDMDFENHLLTYLLPALSFYVSWEWAVKLNVFLKYCNFRSNNIFLAL